LSQLPSPSANDEGGRVYDDEEGEEERREGLQVTTNTVTDEVEYEEERN
jgi:hypothetical protein